MACPYHQKDYGKDYLSACKVKDKHLELPNKLHIELFCLSKISFEWCTKYQKEEKAERKRKKITQIE